MAVPYNIRDKSKNIMQRLPYSIRCVLYNQQINPIVHQAHTGFGLPREQPESALRIHRAIILIVNEISG